MNKPKWKDTFYYTQRERKGIFVLALLLLALLIVSPFIERLHTPTKVDFTAFKQAIKEFEASQQQPTTPIKSAQFFAFNPNTTSKVDFIKLGLKEAIAQRIVNYRKKGGRFYQKEDLQKIYGLSKKDYEQLVAYITIPTAKTPTPQTFKKTVRRLRPRPFDPNTVSSKDLLNMGLPTKTVQQWMRYRQKGGTFKRATDITKLYALTAPEAKQLIPYAQILPTSSPQKARVVNNQQASDPPIAAATIDTQLDVNSASMQEWEQLKGIGPYYAKRIIFFRGKLGGFASIEQIGGTYGLPDSVFQKVKPRLILSPISKLLPINRATVETLANHPYIQKKQAKTIVNYKKNHGAFRKWEDLRKVRVFSELELQRLRPYLKF